MMRGARPNTLYPSRELPGVIVVPSRATESQRLGPIDPGLLAYRPAELAERQPATGSTISGASRPARLTAVESANRPAIENTQRTLRASGF